MSIPVWRPLHCFIPKYLPIALSALMLQCGKPQSDRAREAIRSVPQVVLWVWERREDLSFINPREVGVAFLATTIQIRMKTIDVKPRLQGFRVPPSTALVAVTRIETSSQERPLFSLSQRRKILATISRTAGLEGVIAVQIDFDARQSERDFYADLLKDLRRALPDSIALSMTALCSWCMFDTWVSDVPADEIVPMYFRMGRDSSAVRLHMIQNGSFPETRCNGSIGISTDEPGPGPTGERRTYIFSSERWTRETFLKVSRELTR